MKVALLPPPSSYTLCIASSPSQRILWRGKSSWLLEYTGQDPHYLQGTEILLSIAVDYAHLIPFL